MKFALTIALGNDLMRDGADVAGALRRLANQFEDFNPPLVPEDGHVRDDNGQTVGRWSFTDTE